MFTHFWDIEKMANAESSSRITAYSLGKNGSRGRTRSDYP
jgi:hypothetical protein